MKKLFLLMATIASGSVFAQTESGKFMVNGATSLNFAFTNVKNVYDGNTVAESKKNTFTFTPTVGYFVINNLAVGIKGSYSYMTPGRSGNGSKAIFTMIQLMPVASYYIPVSGKLRPFAQLGVGLASTSEKIVSKEGETVKSGEKGSCFSLGGGVSYFLVDHVAFSFGLSYSIVNLTNNDDNKYKTKTGAFGSDFGISVYF
jgi:outer membrane protein